jgi:muramoyltetrapeptide carboxypeptidase
VGDTVDIIAPGSVGQKAYLKKAIAMLHQWGLKTRVPDDLYGGTKIVSNTDRRRFEHLRDALNSESAAIWCVRGGYGSLRLLPALAKLKRPVQQKLLIGYSDITSLHIYLNQKWRWPTLHGPLLDRLGKGSGSERETRFLKQVLFGEKTTADFKNLQRIETSKNQKQILNSQRTKTLRAPVLGGNLMIAQSTIGTPYELKGRGRILFFEEIGEKAYRFDRVLHHMEQAGVFTGTKAVIFGHITGVEPGELRLIRHLILREFAERSSFPVFTGLNSGHGQLQLALPLGTPAVLKIRGGSAQLQVQTFD